jgi:predicted nucleic acid-binding protein
VKEDEPDNRILECAAEAGSEFIISADKDLLRLGSYAGAPIMRVANFLQRREEQREQ